MTGRPNDRTPCAHGSDKNDNDDGYDDKNDDNDDDGDGDGDGDDDDNDGGAAGFLRRVSIGFCPGSAEINLQKIVKSSPGGKSAECFCFFCYF